MIEDHAFAHQTQRIGKRWRELGKPLSRDAFEVEDDEVLLHRRSRADSAAECAGTGLLFGSVAGADYAGYSSYQLQRQYDVSYGQCMYARGNRVPAQFVYLSLIHI